ncbi:SpoIIE family protein phosphatase [Planomonospora sp. ID67723]|uniref:PP2C family protein-serine/threonine phosphatase n=1 Tax=Planomonospora sp. ID67723 TaxID=2738134 RepID=UPI0018C40368|nr:SpoIIE family protein phosphatase [Planomonospora sp. ID67723]MBG0832179.1 SpoIIE family protein phosphatase [Planomonospora sp. ID67723]
MPSAGRSGEDVRRARRRPAAEGVDENLEDLYENAPFGYLSTLMDGTIVKVNTTFLTLTGYTREELVGRARIQSLLPVGDRIFYETHFAPLLAIQGQVREIAVELKSAGGARLPVLLNGAVRRPAPDRPALVRFSVAPATDRREYERELLRARQRAERSEAETRQLAQILQASFVPPELPPVPGMDAAGVYRPAGRGDEVGGDFYDLFETPRGWALSLGDVCGKGAQAAVVTGLARYTLRTAGMQRTRPRDALALLNQAVLRERTDRFLTAVYAQIDRDGGEGPRVTFSLAGHPPPVRVAAAGGIEPVGRPGTLLGVFQDPALHESVVDLSPGDVLVFFTDGIIEGHGAADLFGEERLAGTLEATRGLDAKGIATRLVDEVVSFQSGLPSDDIAVLVLRVPREAPVPDTPEGVEGPGSGLA